MDPNKQKRVASQRCELIDDKEYGVIGFSEPITILEGGFDAPNNVLLPLSRTNGKDDDVIVHWEVDMHSDGSDFVISDSQQGSVGFSNDEDFATVVIALISDWVDEFVETNSSDIIVKLTGAEYGAVISNDPDKQFCNIRLIPADRGQLSVDIDPKSLQWPPPDDSVNVFIKRTDNAYGRAYVQWAVKSPPGDGSDMEEDVLEDWFDATSGDVHIPAGENQVTVKIPVHTKQAELRVIPPKNPLEFNFTVDCITPGIEIDEKEKCHTFSLQPPSNRPGEVSFNESKVIVNRSDNVAIVSLHRENGNDGYVEVDYTIVDGTAKSGKHFEGVTIDTVHFYNGENEKNIVIPRMPEIYKDTKTFKIELRDVRNGGELGDITEKKVHLQPTFIEPPGKISLPKSLQHDKKFSCNTADKVVIPIERTHGHGGKVTFNIKTMDNTAHAGEHFEKVDETVTLEDGQTAAEVEIPLLKSRYKNKIDFNVTIANPQKGIAFGKVTSINVKLNPTITEPPGEITLPTNNADIVVCANNDESIVIPLLRKHGNGGDVTITCETKDLSAHDGEHYKGLHKEKITLRDLEDETQIRISLIKTSYRKDKEFLIKVSNPQGGAKLKGVKEKKIVLKATDTEPCGELNLQETVKVDANNADIIKVPIRRVNGTGGTLCVQYATKNESAFAGQHYNPSSGVLRLKPGEDHTQIEIPLIKATYKKDLKFKLNFDKVKGEETIQSSQSCNISLLSTYVEPPGVLTLPESKSLKKWSSNNNDFVVIPIQRLNGHGGDVKVHIKTSDGTAKSGQHFVEFDDKVTLPDSVTKYDIKIPLINSRYKDNVQFTVELSEPENGALLGDKTSVDVNLVPTITEPPGVIAFSPYDVIVDKRKENEVVIPIKRENGSGGNVSFKCVTEDISAKQGVHYKRLSKIYKIDDLAEEAIITIQLEPTQFRKDLKFMVSLTEPTGGLTLEKPSRQTIVLKATDTEPCGDLELPNNINFSVKEGSDKIIIPIKRVNGSGGVLTARYFTKSDSAKAGEHFEPVDDKIHLEPGIDATSIEIPVLDNKHSKDLKFKLCLDKTDDLDTIDKSLEYEIVLRKTYDEPPGSFCLAGLSYDIYADSREIAIVVIPVERLGGTGGDVNVTYKTSDGSAVSGTHYTPKEGVLEFKDGEDKKDIVVDLIPSKYRRNLKFDVELCDCTGNADIKRKSVCVYLKRTDETEQGSVELPPNHLLEISANKRNSLFVPLKRVGGTGGEIDIHYKTVDQTAKGGKHYITSTGVFKLKDGEREGGFEIPILKDTYRNSLNFAVHLQHATDDDKKVEKELQVNLLPTYISKPGKFGFNDNEDLNFFPLETNVATVSIYRKDGRDGAIEFDFETKEITAKEHEHFTPLKRSVKLLDQTNVAELNIPINQSAEFTRPVQFEVLVTPTKTPENLELGILKQTVTILPTQKEPVGIFGFPKEHFKFSVVDTDAVNIPVERREGAGGSVEIDYFTRDNTAIAGTHYKESIGVLTFNDGDSEKFIDIPVSKEAEYEQPLSFSVELGGTSEGDDIVALYETEVILQPTVEVSSSSSSSSSDSESIESDDRDPGVIGFSSFKYEFSTNAMIQKSHASVATIPVQRTEATNGKVSVDYFTRDNTAIAGVHYEDTRGKLTFKDGEGQKQIEVKLNENAKFSEPLSFTTELGATTRNADVLIYETEVVLQPTASEPSEVGSTSSETVRMQRTTEYVTQQTVNMVEVSEFVETEVTGDPGELGFPTDYYEFDGTNKTEVAVPIERTYGQTGAVNVEWFTRENTAIAGRDFVESSGVVEFIHGQAMQYIHIPIIPNKDLTGECTFIVELGQATNNATIGCYEATVALINEESQKGFLIKCNNKKSKLNAKCF